jgi:diaminopimelate decarboxylase
LTALEAGFSPEQILLTSQQSPHNMAELVEKGVQFNATSLRQIELYGQAARGGKSL